MASGGIRGGDWGCFSFNGIKRPKANGPDQRGEPADPQFPAGTITEGSDSTLVQNCILRIHKGLRIEPKMPKNFFYRQSQITNSTSLNSGVIFPCSGSSLHLVSVCVCHKASG